MVRLADFLEAPQVIVSLCATDVPHGNLFLPSEPLAVSQMEVR